MQIGTLLHGIKLPLFTEFLCTIILRAEKQMGGDQMSERKIRAGYYRRYDGKVVYVISLATDADTGEESVIWTTYPFADAHQMNRGSVDYQQKKFFPALARLL